MSDPEERLSLYRPDTLSSVELPLAESTVQAGFPSPADDFLEGTLDLNRALVRHPSSTFFARVEGDSMRGDCIASGDLLVIDKSLEAHDGSLAVAYVDGEFTLKRVRIDPRGVWLVPSNPRYPEIPITAENRFVVWGVVTFVVKKM